MSLPPRPTQVRGLMDDPAFAQRILDRILAVLDIKDEDERSILDLQTSGTIPTAVLDQIVVVWIAPNQHLAARVEFSEAGDGACRLILRPWMGFVNHDPDQLMLEQGIHLWLGAAWRHIPINS
ncbi:MAG: hypothetical protein UY76_C0016G0004 [Candidatus Uhrbacteria bacterium GW2011_GWA2_52_8d]|uniref:Uncharacterized protein n=1 Tax=Candidatus Uhrbacteria bacterium GW2011_GWA2_52_8d TaxID=1618979 RepID=A0A0G1ZWR1_9BACT|nr:MAG: hypothetical protein UY76_C0016G0004 [Candidatus Uhrbacteria bacterium GW2011_GWA2_52_8d]